MMVALFFLPYGLRKIPPGTKKANNWPSAGRPVVCLWAGPRCHRKMKTSYTVQRCFLIKHKFRIQEIQGILLLVRAVMHEIAYNGFRGMIQGKTDLFLPLHPLPEYPGEIII